MTELKIYWPFKPYFIRQRWGARNEIAYDQFGFTAHNGIDASVAYDGPDRSYHPKTWMVFCPVENFRVLLVRYMPGGGGHEVWLISKDKLKVGDRECHAYLVLCHGEKILVQPGYEPKLGELIMIADNTGFSTGPHTHMGLYRVDWDGKLMTYLDQNEANGSYDPEPFFTKHYAVDVADVGALVTSGLRYCKYISGIA
jgi:hypothetical protein